jgi:hypothetical protein
MPGEFSHVRWPRKSGRTLLVISALSLVLLAADDAFSNVGPPPAAGIHSGGPPCASRHSASASPCRTKTRTESPPALTGKHRYSVITDPPITKRSPTAIPARNSPPPTNPTPCTSNTRAPTPSASPTPTPSAYSTPTPSASPAPTPSAYSTPTPSAFPTTTPCASADNHASARRHTHRHISHAHQRSDRKDPAPCESCAQSPRQQMASSS